MTFKARTQFSPLCGQPLMLWPSVARLCMRQEPPLPIYLREDCRREAQVSLRSFPIQDISDKSYVPPQGAEMSEEKMTREHLNWRKEKEMAAIEDRRVKSGNKRSRGRRERVQRQRETEDEGDRAQSQHRNRVDQTLLPRARGNIRVLRCLGESTKRKRRIQENLYTNFVP